MQRKFPGITAAALGAALLGPTAASAEMTCPQLKDWLKTQSFICTTAGTPTTSPLCPADVTMVTTAGASGRCELTFTYSEKAGTPDGYEPDTNTRQGRQLLILRVGLPNNVAEAGAGGIQGAWNGKQRNIGGGGLVGAVGAVTAATNTRYVGTSGDSGHSNADGGNGQWAVQQATHELNKGKLRDFVYDSLEQQFKWGKALAAQYYGTAVTRNYWDGCSTGGRQGLSLAEKFGDQFDGILAGSPAINNQQFRLADMHPNIANRDIAGSSVTAAQFTNTNSRAIAACDTNPGQAAGQHDGFSNDPRRCTLDASANMCGAPGAAAVPNCLSSQTQVDVINTIWSGPRNQFGKRIWYPFDRGVNVGIGAGIPGSSTQVAQSNHMDTTFNSARIYLNEAARVAAGSLPGSITYEDEATLGSNVASSYWDICVAGQCANPDLSLAKAHGTKILMHHGTQDPLIRWRHTLDYYRRTAAYFNGGNPDFSTLAPWFQFFMIPGNGHCGGGVGPQVNNSLFDAMVNWVENGTPPQQSIRPNSLTAGTQRPLCPYPQTATYTGPASPAGSPNYNVLANYTCSGNLETKTNSCLDLKTKWQHENENDLQPVGRFSATTCQM